MQSHTQCAIMLAFVPIYIAYAALVAFPDLVKLFNDEDARVIQRILDVVAVA